MNWLKILPIFALPFALTSGAAFAQSGREFQSGWGFDHMMSWGGGWGGMVLGPIMMIIILVIVVLVVVAVLRGLGVIEPTGASGTNKPSALEILERRFASGEIDEAEFTSRKQALEK